MINLPRPPVRGERLTADLLRDIIAAIRQCRPIAGAGINLQESLNGVVIAATPQDEAEAAEEFTHRFQMSYEETTADYSQTASSVSAEEGASTPSYDLLIQKGTLFAIEDDVASEQTFTLGSGISQDSDDDDLWRIASASDGALYVTYDETTETYTLNYDSDTTSALYIIAEFKSSESSSNPYPVITQRVIGDIFHVLAGSVKPAAWTVRKFTTTNEDGSTSTVWKVFSPLWVNGRTQDYYQNTGPGEWITLSSSDGTLYAYRTWIGEKNEDGENTWTPDENGIQITNSTGEIPADVDPVAAVGTSPATKGSKSIIVTIGQFSVNANGDTTWDQVHLGAITASVANAGASSGLALGTPEIRTVDGEQYLCQDLGTWAIDASGTATFTSQVENAVKILAPSRYLLSATASTENSSGDFLPDQIAHAPVPVPFADDETNWLFKKTVTPGVVSIDGAENETSEGAVGQKQNTLVYFSDEDPTDPDPTELWPTFIRDANESTTYSSGSSSSSSGS